MESSKPEIPMKLLVLLAAVAATAQPLGNATNCVDFVLDDSFGDGWNDAEYSITAMDGGVVAAGTMIWGFTQTDEICFDTTGSSCFELIVTSGGYPSEISWRVLRNTSNETTVLSGFAPDEANFFVSPGGVVTQASCTTAKPSLTPAPTLALERHFSETVRCFEENCVVYASFNTSFADYYVASAALRIDLEGDFGETSEYATISINGGADARCGDDFVSDCVKETCSSFNGSDVTWAARSGTVDISFAVPATVEACCGAVSGVGVYAFEADVELVLELSQTTHPTSVPTPLPSPSPTSQPSKTPTAGPVPTPVPTSTRAPTQSYPPTPLPTTSPTPLPTASPIPTTSLTSAPTAPPLPTSRPTLTITPSSCPTPIPTSLPSTSPTSAPTIFSPRRYFGSCRFVANCVLKAVFNTSGVTDFISSADLIVDVQGDLGSTNEFVEIEINGADFGICGTTDDCVKARCSSFDTARITAEARKGALEISFSGSPSVDAICDPKDADVYAFRVNAALVLEFHEETDKPTPVPTILGGFVVPSPSPSTSPSSSPSSSHVPTMRPTTVAPSSAFEEFSGLKASLEGETREMIAVHGVIVFETRIRINNGTGFHIIGDNDAALDGDGNMPLLDLTDADLVLENIALQNGFRSANGGCIRATKSHIELVHVTVVNCTGGFGGGFSIDSNTALIARGSVFQSNFAEHDGGVAWVFGSTFEAQGCTFISNHASRVRAVRCTD